MIFHLPTSLIYRLSPRLPLHVVAAGLYFTGLVLFNLMYSMSHSQFSSHLTVAQMMLFRYGLGTFFYLPFCLKNPRQFIPRRPLIVSLRVVIGIFLLWSNFFCFRYLPLALAALFSLTSPFFSIFLAAFFFKEKITKDYLAACLFCLCGLLISIFSHTPAVGGQSAVPRSDLFIPAVAIAIITAVIRGGQVNILKNLTRDHSPLSISMFLNIGALPLAIVFAATHWVSLGARDVVFLSVLALLGNISQVLQAYGLKLGRISDLMPISFLNLPISALFGYLFFQESLSLPNILGILITILSIYYIAKKRSP